MTLCEPCDHGVRIRLRVQPHAKKTRIQGILLDLLDHDVLKIAVAAPPVDHAANLALVSYLSKLWDIPKSLFEIMSGAHSRNKMLLIKGEALELSKKIEGYLHEGGHI